VLAVRVDEAAHRDMTHHGFANTLRGERGLDTGRRSADAGLSPFLQGFLPTDGVV
jgi:hypothetical protein